MLPENANGPGAAALLCLTVASAAGLHALARDGGYPCAAQLPFAATALGGGIGFLWEVRGGPMTWVNYVSALRRANVGLVVGFLSNLALTLAGVAGDAALRRVVVPAAAAWLAAYAWLGHDRWRVTLAVPAAAVAMLALAFVSLPPLVATATATATVAATSPAAVVVSISGVLPLVLYVAGLLALLLAATAGPLAGPRLFSAVFHGGLTLATTLLALALRDFDFGSPPDVSRCPDVFRAPLAFAWHGVARPFLEDPVRPLAVFAGFVVAARSSRRNFNELRYNVAASFWVLLHRFLLSSAGPLPPPAPPVNHSHNNTSATTNTITTNTTPITSATTSGDGCGREGRIDFAAYDALHENAAPLSVPAARRIPLAQRFKYEMLRIVFAVSDWADVNLPASDPLTHPRFKPRVEPRLGMSYYWSAWALGIQPPSTPHAMRAAFVRGELLSYVLLYSHGFRDVRVATEEEKEMVGEVMGDRPNRVLDYTKYEHYAQREGFSPYGGRAFFVAEDRDGGRCDEPGMQVHSLRLLAVVAPRDDASNLIHAVRGGGSKLPYDGDKSVCDDHSDGEEIGDSAGAKGDVSNLSTLPGYDHFNDIQKSIHASSIFVAVTMHHLLEIHTVTSITSVALHNAFDSNISCEEAAMPPHPFRAVMQLHYYSSTEVHEVTTPHLLNSYATFAQVFALQPHATAAALNDHFHDYEYLQDCDFERRGKWMNTPQFRDELRYMQAFMRYARACVRIAWGNASISTDISESTVINGSGGGDSGENVEENEVSDNGNGNDDHGYYSDDSGGPFSDEEREAIEGRLCKDSRMTVFLQELTKRMRSGRLPSRFVATTDVATGAQHWSADGVSQLIAETIHLCTVRHQYLGTKMPLASLDFRFSGLGAQCADGQPPPKEDYVALALIVAATALKPFPTLLDSARWRTRRAVDDSFALYLGKRNPHTAALQRAFGTLVDDVGEGAGRRNKKEGGGEDKEGGGGRGGLRALQQEWEAHGTRANDDRLRVLPDELQLMAGY